MQILCIFFANFMPLLCRFYAQFMHFMQILCIFYPFVMHILCMLYAYFMPTLCILCTFYAHFMQRLHFLCSTRVCYFYAIFMQFLCILCTLCVSKIVYALYAPGTLLMTGPDPALSRLWAASRLCSFKPARRIGGWPYDRQALRRPRATVI